MKKSFNVVFINALKQLWQSTRSFRSIGEPKKQNLFLYLNGCKISYKDKNGNKIRHCLPRRRRRRARGKAQAHTQKKQKHKYPLHKNPPRLQHKPAIFISKFPLPRVLRFSLQLYTMKPRRALCKRHAFANNYWHPSFNVSASQCDTPCTLQLSAR